MTVYFSTLLGFDSRWFLGACFLLTTEVVHNFIDSRRYIRRRGSVLGFGGAGGASFHDLFKYLVGCFSGDTTYFASAKIRRDFINQVRFQSCRTFFLLFQRFNSERAMRDCSKDVFRISVFSYSCGHGRRLQIQDWDALMVHLGIALMVRGSCPMVPFRDHSVIPK